MLDGFLTNTSYHRKFTERSFSAIFIFLSNVKAEASATLKLYRKWDSVEKFFGDMTNTLDIKRLRAHSRLQKFSRNKKMVYLESGYYVYGFFNEVL